MLLLYALAIPLILTMNPLLSVVGISILSYFGSVYMIPRASESFISIGLFGRDRLKVSDQKIPESLGTVVGIIYIFAVTILTPFTLRVDALVAYLSGILSIQSMVMLGFADDLFDLRWRHKFFLPAIASIPLLLVYYVEHGITTIVVPYYGPIDLGWLYYIYMASLAIFATNCINIYAGVNGLEVGQSIVVVCSVIANDLLYLFHDAFIGSLQPDTVRAHTISLFFVVPLLSVSLALIKFNWFPAKIFVGDAYCYFAGMVLAVAGITGHFSKTMLSLIMPQIINFLYSFPQLLKIVPCPRHRMPLMKDGLLYPSRADITDSPGSILVIMKVLKKLKLIEIYQTELSSTDSKHEIDQIENDSTDVDATKATKNAASKTNPTKKIEISNMTVITLVLVHKGPITEEELTRTLIKIQVICCVMALLARHVLAKLIFPNDNI